MADQGLHVERRFVFPSLSLFSLHPLLFPLRWFASSHLFRSPFNAKQKTGGDSESLCVGCKVTRVINYYQVKLP